MFRSLLRALRAFVGGLVEAGDRLWAMLPQTRGAKFLYDSFLKDFLRSNESQIDAALKDASKTAANVAKEAKEVASNIGANLKKDD